MPSGKLHVKQDPLSKLGLMYAKQEGVIQNNLYSRMWWNISAANKDKLGKHNKDLTAKKMTPQDTSNTQDLASECVKKNYKEC
jgi:hypothetical protein